MALGQIPWGGVLPAGWRGRCLLCERALDARDAQAGRVGVFLLPGALGPFCVLHLGYGAKALQRLLEVGAAWWSRCELPADEARPYMPALILPAGDYARLVTLLDNLRNGGYPG